jgi:hypothetical protein
MAEPAVESLGTAEFLAELRRRDVRCWADGERLRVNAPDGTLSGSLQAEIARRKQDILAWFAAAPAAEPTARPRLQPRPGGGPAPLSFAQERMWFLQQLEPESVASNLQTSVPLTGPLDRHALERALSEVVRRHEILRTTFALAQGSPVQRVAAPQPIVLGTDDLSGVVPDATKEEAGHPLRLHPVPSPAGHADGHVVLSRVAGKQRLEPGEQDHEQRRALLPGEAAQVL